QGAGSDRRPGVDRQALAGTRDCRACRARHARTTGLASDVRSVALRDHHFRSVGDARGTRIGIVSRKKPRFDMKKEIRKLARERVGTVPSARVIVPKVARQKPKHKKLIEEAE